MLSIKLFSCHWMDTSQEKAEKSFRNWEHMRLQLHLLFTAILDTFSLSFDEHTQGIWFYLHKDNFRNNRCKYKMGSHKKSWNHNIDWPFELNCNYFKGNRSHLQPALNILKFGMIFWWNIWIHMKTFIWKYENI